MLNGEEPVEAEIMARVVATNSRRIITTIITPLFMLCLPVSMIGVGQTYINTCPINQNIPVFVMLSGCLSGVLVMSLLIVYSNCEHHRYIVLVSKCVFAVLSLVYFAWNLTGSVWVFGVWNEWRKHQGSGNELCNNHVYMFSFVLLIGYWIAFIGSSVFEICVPYTRKRTIVLLEKYIRLKHNYKLWLIIAHFLRCR